MICSKHIRESYSGDNRRQKTATVDNTEGTIYLFKAAKTQIASVTAPPNVFALTWGQMQVKHFKTLMNLARLAITSLLEVVGQMLLQVK